MRQIKFRAWDQERNEMLPITSMDWNAWWVSCEPILEGKRSPSEYGERNSFKNEETDRHILMQYTGLTDRNGKEIYEGDIATAKNWGTQVISFKSGMFKFGNMSLVTFTSVGNEFACEIIGNIYANPELVSA